MPKELNECIPRTEACLSDMVAAAEAWLLPTDMPTSAAASATRSLIPSPQYMHVAPNPCNMHTSTHVIWPKFSMLGVVLCQSGRSAIGLFCNIRLSIRSISVCHLECSSVAGPLCTGSLHQLVCACSKIPVKMQFHNELEVTKTAALVAMDCTFHRHGADVLRPDSD